MWSQCFSPCRCCYFGASAYRKTTRPLRPGDISFPLDVIFRRESSSRMLIGKHPCPVSHGSGRLPRSFSGLKKLPARPLPSSSFLRQRPFFRESSFGESCSRKVSAVLYRAKRKNASSQMCRVILLHRDDRRGLFFLAFYFRIVSSS